MAHSYESGLVVVLMVGSYPIIESTDRTKVKGAKTVHAISYAGSGIPRLAKADDAIKYKTYSEYHEAFEEIVKSTNEIKKNGGWATVAGIILRRMSESAVVTHGETKFREGPMDTPTHFGPEPKASDGSTINPYSLESISTTSALVPVGHDPTTNVHKEVAKEKHRPPLPGDVTPTLQEDPKDPRPRQPKRKVV